MMTPMRRQADMLRAADCAVSPCFFYCTEPSSTLPASASARSTKQLSSIPSAPIRSCGRAVSESVFLDGPRRAADKGENLQWSCAPLVTHVRNDMALFLNGDFPNWHSIQRRPKTPEFFAKKFDQARQLAVASRNGGGITGRPPTTLESVEAMRALNGSTVVLSGSPSAAFIKRQREGRPVSALSRPPSAPSLYRGHIDLEMLKLPSKEDVERSKHVASLQERRRALKQLEKQVERQLSRSKLERSSSKLIMTMDDVRTKQLLDECDKETSTTSHVIQSTMTPPQTPLPPPPPPAPPPRPMMRAPPKFDYKRFYQASTSASDGQRALPIVTHQHEVNAARQAQRRAMLAKKVALADTNRHPQSSPYPLQPARRPMSASELPRPSSVSSNKPKPPLSYNLSYGSLGVWAAFRYKDA